MIPNSIEERKALQIYINDIVDNLLKIDSLQEHIREICEDSKEALEIKPAELKKRAKLRFYQQYKPDKYQKMKEEAEELFTENDVLFGVASD